MNWSWDGYTDHPPIAEVLSEAEKAAAAAEEGSEAWAEPLVWAAMWQSRDLGEKDHLELEAVAKLDALLHRTPNPVERANFETRRHFYVRLGHNCKRALMFDDAIDAYNRVISLSEEEYGWSWRTPECMAYVAHTLCDAERYDLARRTAGAALDYLRRHCTETANEKDQWADVSYALERAYRGLGDEQEAQRWSDTYKRLQDDPMSVIRPTGTSGRDELALLPPLNTIVDAFEAGQAKPAELLKRVETRCITEPPNSLWHGMRHYLLAKTATDRHTALAHLRNAVDAAWPYGASPLLITILEDAATTAAELEVWAGEESYLESMLDIQQRSFGENSAEHLRARFRLAVCHSRLYDVRACRQELLRLRKLVLTRFPEDRQFEADIGAELAKLAGPEEAEALETLDRRAALDEALRELDAMVGLAEIKEHVRRLVSFLAVSRERERAGLPRVQRGFHFVFLGPPGTGKTTVARLIARIFWALELLPTDTTVEAGRVDLVGGYIGQTALKTEELVKRALDGVLFVDEAYALMSTSGNDFGQEAVAELIKHMENDRDRLVVILAGYTREMEQMLEMNPGLASRVNEQLYFPSYDDAELEQIFRSFCARARYELSEGAELRLPEVIAEMRRKAGKSFGNAREIRNLFEDAIVLQAARLQDVSGRDEAALRTLDSGDLAVIGEARASSRSIGFT